MRVTSDMGGARMPFRPASEPLPHSVATFVLGAEGVESGLPPAPRLRP